MLRKPSGSSHARGCVSAPACVCRHTLLMLLFFPFFLTEMRPVGANVNTHSHTDWADNSWPVFMCNVLNRWLQNWFSLVHARVRIRPYLCAKNACKGRHWPSVQKHTGFLKVIFSGAQDVSTQSGRGSSRSGVHKNTYLTLKRHPDVQGKECETRRKGGALRHHSSGSSWWHQAAANEMDAEG